MLAPSSEFPYAVMLEKHLQLRLNFRRQVGDVAEVKRGSGILCQTAPPNSSRVGHAQDLVLKGLRRQSRALDADERMKGSAGILVEESGEMRLPCPARPNKKHGKIKDGEPLKLSQHPLHGNALRNDPVRIMKRAAARDGLLQIKASVAVR